MVKRHLKHFDILEAKRAYSEGKNVTELLRAQKNVDFNTPEIIEVAYDLQAGSYIKHALSDPKYADAYSSELAEILCGHIEENFSLLDIGTGELTTLSRLICKLKKKPKEVYAFDISWSRLSKGLEYAKEVMASDYKILKAFSADISEIPLRDKSIDITTSSHALEPNGGKLKELMSELFRITSKKLVLFEPCFEINTPEGKQRMDRLGYIKDIDGIVNELGGKMMEKIKIRSTINPLNPTACFIIEPPMTSAETHKKNSTNDNIFSVPGTDIPLIKVDEYYFSIETGLCYPLLRNIPILKSNSAILASSLCD